MQFDGLSAHEELTSDPVHLCCMTCVVSGIHFHNIIMTSSVSQDRPVLYDVIHVLYGVGGIV